MSMIALPLAWSMAARTALCRSAVLPTGPLGSLCPARSLSIFAFRPTLVSKERRQPPRLGRHESAITAAPSRKPEDLYPESFPLSEKDLVNPSGRIYSVYRSPIEEGPHEQSRRTPLLDEEGSQENILAVPLVDAKPPPIFRAILFVGVTGACIYYAAAKYAVSQAHEISDRLTPGIFGNLTSFFGGSGNEEPRSGRGQHVEEKRLRALRKQELAEKMGWQVAWLRGWCDQLGIPEGGKTFVSRIYTWAAESYLHLPESAVPIVPIVACNALILLGWRVSMIRRPWERFMARCFLHAPASGRTFTLLTSNFSHLGPLHFLFNHLALWSFGATAFLHPRFFAGEDGVGTHTSEVSMTSHFLAFFALAGLASCLASHLLTASRFRITVAQKGLEYARLHIGRIGSLGASGAVYATVVTSALAYPEARIQLLFLPMFNAPIQDGVKGLVAIDVLGLLLGWRYLDHAAHLGGAAFGYFYFKYGNKFWESCKDSARP